MKDGIMRLTYKNQSEEIKNDIKSCNNSLQKMRYVVERTFGGFVLWFKGKRSRYYSLDKVNCFHGMLAIAYNTKAHFKVV